MNSILTLLRILTAFIAGVVLAFILLIGVELLSNVVHPLPSEFKGTREEICQHVANYPTWVLAVVVVACGAPSQQFQPGQLDESATLTLQRSLEFY